MAALAFQSLWTRSAILLCFWCAILVSIPYWLRFTTIQRLPLPKSEVYELETGAECPVLFSTSLNVLVDPDLISDHQEPFLSQVQALILDSFRVKTNLEKGTSLDCVRWDVRTRLHNNVDMADFVAFDVDSLTHTVRVGIESSSVSSHSAPFIKLQDTQHEVLPDAVSAAVVAHILALRGDTALSLDFNEPTSGITAAEQDPRIIQYNKHVRLVFSIMNQDITSGAAYDSALIHNLARSTDSGSKLSNPIAELLEQLSDLHDFHVESQVQWFAPLQFQPTQERLEEVVEVEDEEIVMVDEEFEEEIEIDSDTPQDNHEAPNVQSTEKEEDEEVEALLPPKKTDTRKGIRQVPQVQKVMRQTRTPLPTRHVVEWDDLKVFVNSAEWSLISTVPPPASEVVRADDRPFDRMSHTHDLHFLLYIPSQTNTPLLLRSPNGSEVSDATAWLIPQWGGVVILNPPSDAGSSVAVMSSFETSHSGAVTDLPAPQVAEAIKLFARQLRILLGFGVETSSSAENEATQVDAQIADTVRLQILMQRRILETSREAVNTLGGIVRLVDKIENLGVGPDVQHDVQLAIQTLHSISAHTDEAQTPGVTGDLAGVLNKVQHAHALANRAFFNPDMLGLLYFPDEQKYAVYTPLFGPLLVPLIVTTVKLIKAAISASASRKTKSHRRATPRTSTTHL